MAMDLATMVPTIGLTLWRVAVGREGMLTNTHIQERGLTNYGRCRKGAEDSILREKEGWG